VIFIDTNLLLYAFTVLPPEIFALRLHRLPNYAKARAAKA
jgi:hypothetical protein